MIDDGRTASSRLFGIWGLLVLVPAALYLVDISLVRLSGATLYIAAAIAVVGGCGCVTMSKERVVTKFAAMCITIVVVAAEIMTLGAISLMLDGLTGTQ